MNFKAITGPLTERMSSLTALVQEMSDNIKLQTDIQGQILSKLNDIDERINKENTAENPKVPD